MRIRTRLVFGTFFGAVLPPGTFHAAAKPPVIPN